MVFFGRATGFSVHSSRLATATASTISRSMASSPRSAFKKNAKLHRAKTQKFDPLAQIRSGERFSIHVHADGFEIGEGPFQRRRHPPDVPFLQGQGGNLFHVRSDILVLHPRLYQ